ncbi:MAG: hypothetical protein IPP66_18305 [Anaerolineales bacterium]|nr:hypothetical protein [Anaerolineales bacterium]
MDQIQARLKSIRETLENDLELRAAKEAVAKADALHKEANNALKQSEADFEKQRIKIEQTESNLYSGQVHNPKELQDLQMEIVSLKKHLVTLEERELEVMIQFEDAEKSLQAANEKLQRVQANLKDQNIDLTHESDVLNKDLESLDSERKAVIGNIENQMITIYDRLRQQKRGVAVTTMSDACDACGTTFTPSQQQTARSNSQLFYCPTCGRIIYAG